MRVVFLVGHDGESTRKSIEAVCATAGIHPVAVLLDTERMSWKRRLKNMRRNVRREGWGYLPSRAIGLLRGITDALVERAGPSRKEVDALLRKAFPARCFSLEELGTKYGFAVHRVGNLNGPAAISALSECNADLGIVLGTRVLRAGTFRIPKHGCVNLHKGKVPEYRGMPPGFWELYDGVQTAGVTVHFVDDGLDTGDVVACSEIPISPVETPDSLIEKLHDEGARILQQAVVFIRDGLATPREQPRGSVRARTRPTRAQIAELRARLPHWKQPQKDTRILLKNVVVLLLLYSGVLAAVRAFRRARKDSRGVVLLYHRVNDYSKDVLTVDTRTFAAHLLALSKHYPFIRSCDLVGRLREGRRIPATSIAIHFDDCYQDVYTNGAALLNAAGVPATAFVNSGFIDTDRVFDHDRVKYPFRYPNLRREDVVAWVASGLEVGAHTVNHVDLGSFLGEKARVEIVECRRMLEALCGQPVTLFSYPFGEQRNISEETIAMVRQAGYDALFSAHGGLVQDETDLFDIPRRGGDAMHKPLYLLVEIEGLAFWQKTATPSTSSRTRKVVEDRQRASGA